MTRMRRTLTGVGALLAVTLTLTGCTAAMNWVAGVVGPPDQDQHVNPDNLVNPDATGLDRFLTQELSWDSCTGGEAECATVGAPMDWDNPDSEPIHLALAKYPATGESQGAIFVNPGGPGSGGAEFVRESIDTAVSAQLREHYDIVGWDPRGTGDSSNVFCYTDEELDEELFGDPREWADLEPGSDEWIEVARDEARAYGEACLEGTGDLLGFVDTVSTAKDLDLLRHLVGDEQLNYLGYSYGTFLGTTYAELFPERAGRLVLDGAIAPDVTLHEVVLTQQQGFEDATRAYLRACEGMDSCPYASGEDAGMQRISALLDRINEHPLKGGDGRWVDVDTAITAIITTLYAEESWPILSDLLAELEQGETGTAQFIADFYYDREGGTYINNSTVAFSAINCLDYPRGASVDEMRAQAKEIAEAAPVYGKYAGYGDLSCEEWPFPGNDDRGAMHAEGADPILVIGTTGDPATPYPWAKRLATQLDSGVLLTYEGEGHVAYGGKSVCVDTTVDEFFIKGTVPDDQTVC